MRSSKNWALNFIYCSIALWMNSGNPVMNCFLKPFAVCVAGKWCFNPDTMANSESSKFSEKNLTLCVHKKICLKISTAQNNAKRLPHRLKRKNLRPQFNTPVTQTRSGSHNPVCFSKMRISFVPFIIRGDRPLFWPVRAPEKQGC